MAASTNQARRRRGTAASYQPDAPVANRLYSSCFWRDDIAVRASLGPLLLLIAFSVGCGAEPAETAPQESAPAETPQEPAQEEDFPEEDEVPLAGEDEEDVDAMDEHALEAACFAGSQAACDRLGH